MEASAVTEPMVVFDADEVRTVVPLEFAEDLTEPHSWHPIVPVGTWRHPKHGEVTITEADVRELADHFAANVLEQRVPVDQAEGHSQELDGAFGWLEEVEVREGGLYGRLSWTPKGEAAVRERRFAYLSPVVHTRDKPMIGRDGQPVPNVVKAIALTNHPVFKGQPELTINMSEYEAVADEADPDPTIAPEPKPTGGDAMQDEETTQKREEAVEASEDATPDEQPPTASEAGEALEASEEEVADETGEEAATDAGTEEATGEGAEDAEADPAETEIETPEATVLMSELEAAKARIAVLERNEAERDARDRFAALEFSEVVQGDKGRAIRRASKLSPAALDTLTELYLALPDEDMREKLVAFAEGDNTRVPLGEWGPQDAVAFAETSGGAGSITRALEKMREQYPDDTIDGALKFAEAEGLTEAKDAPKAVQGFLKQRYNLG